MVIIVRKKKSVQPVQEVKKAQVLSMKYFIKKFPNVDGYHIYNAYIKSRWILITADKCLEDHGALYTNFFKYMVAICLKLGKEKTLNLIYGKSIPLYMVIKMHGSNEDAENWKQEAKNCEGKSRKSEKADKENEGQNKKPTAYISKAGRNPGQNGSLQRDNRVRVYRAGSNGT